MGAASFLALVARHSALLAVRNPSKPSAEAHLGDGFQQQLHSTAHAQYLAEQQPAGAMQLQLLSRFHLDLEERLQQLQLHGIGNAHLNWLLDALASTLSTHSSLQLALKAAASTSSAPPAAALVAKHRADEVLSMLDACNALKQVADDMDRQFGCLEHALQSVGDALDSEKPLSAGRIPAAARRLSVYCLTNVPSTSGKQYRPLAEARASLLLAAKRELQSAPTPDLTTTLLNQAIDGAMLTSLLVLASAVSSLAPPSHKKKPGTITGACKMLINYLGVKSVSASWAGLLRQLHRDLRREELSAAGGALFQEVQGFHSAATDLHATITNPGVLGIELAVVKQRVESLRKSLQEAQACMSMFRKQMSSFFQALVALRLALLDTSAV